MFGKKYSVQNTDNTTRDKFDRTTNVLFNSGFVNV